MGRRRGYSREPGRWRLFIFVMWAATMAMWALSKEYEAWNQRRTLQFIWEKAEKRQPQFRR